MITNAMMEYNTGLIRDKVAKASYRIGGEDFIVDLESKSNKPKRVDFSLKIKASHRPGETCERVCLLDENNVELFYRDVNIERNADYGDTLYIYTIDFENVED